MNGKSCVTNLAAAVGRRIQETFFAPIPFSGDEPLARLEIVPKGPIAPRALEALNYEAVIPCDESVVRISFATINAETVASEPPRYRLTLAPIKRGRDDNRTAFALAVQDGLTRGRHWFQEVRTIRLCNPLSPDDSCPCRNGAYAPAENLALSEVLDALTEPPLEDELLARLDRAFEEMILQDLAGEPDYPEIEIVLDEAS